MINSKTHKNASLELIIPVYNESDALPFLFHELKSIFSSDNLTKNNIIHIHYLFIDDGSSDSTASLIQHEIEMGLPATLFRFSRNFGHQNAVSAGLSKSNADLTAIIDADLQDPPQVIFKMIQAWREGYDVVYGQRTKRKENIIKVLRLSVVDRFNTLIFFSKTIFKFQVTRKK